MSRLDLSSIPVLKGTGYPEAFAELVDQLKSIFDVLIFDSVALDRGSDAVVLQQQADTVLAVVRRKRSKLTGFAELSRQIDPPRLSGVVFNRA